MPPSRKKIAECIERLRGSPNNVRASEAIWLLEAVGFARDAKGGSDHTYRRAGFLPVTVPYHRTTDQLKLYAARLVVQRASEAFESDESEERDAEAGS